eukprot:COSAG02_NODE_59230_length_275_cov_0.568182_1_plen_38_part_10
MKFATATPMQTHEYIDARASAMQFGECVLAIGNMLEFP